MVKKASESREKTIHNIHVWVILLEVFVRILGEPVKVFRSKNGVVSFSILCLKDACHCT